jgi:hypothetical protein
MESVLILTAIYFVGYLISYLHLKRYTKKQAKSYTRQDRAIIMIASTLSWVLLGIIAGVNLHRKFTKKPYDWEREVKW